MIFKNIKCYHCVRLTLMLIMLLNYVIGAPSSGINDFLNYTKHHDGIIVNHNDKNDDNDDDDDDDEDQVLSSIISIDGNNTDIDFLVPPYSPDDEVLTQVVDLDDPHSAVLTQFNISKDDILRRIAVATSNSNGNNNNQNNHNNNNNGRQDSIDYDFNNSQIPTNLNTTREMFTQYFRRKIEDSVGRNESKQEMSDTVIHEMALYAVCSKNNITSWLEDNTAKLYFSSNIFDKLTPNNYINRAELRLRQVNSENVRQSSSTPDCSEPEELIRVTISVFIRKPNGELQKRVCNSFTMPRYGNEWISINVKQVIKLWQKDYQSYNNKAAIPDPMLAIEVENQDRQTLKAGTFFEPTNCQASPAIPWTFYRNEIRNSSGTVTVPKNPRLDLNWTRHSTSIQTNHYRNHYFSRNFKRHENFKFMRSQSQQNDNENFKYVTDGMSSKNADHHQHINNHYNNQNYAVGHHQTHRRNHQSHHQHQQQQHATHHQQPIQTKYHHRQQIIYDKESI